MKDCCLGVVMSIPKKVIKEHAISGAFPDVFGLGLFQGWLFSVSCERCFSMFPRGLVPHSSHQP